MKHKHIIILGAQGSGKTTMLNMMKKLDAFKDAKFIDAALAAEVNSHLRVKFRCVFAMQHEEFHRLKDLYFDGRSQVFDFNYSVITL